jgi:hypothetical protein
MPRQDINWIGVVVDDAPASVLVVPSGEIGSADADQLAQIIGPHDHYIFRHTESSALIIREE